jgi:hypothetical protein
LPGTRFTCFTGTSTKVQILVQKYKYWHTWRAACQAHSPQPRRKVRRKA